MDIFYKFDSNGYYLGPTYTEGPDTCTDAPELQEGMWPKRVSDSWAYVENHIGEVGYVDDSKVTIVEYGPLPTGWEDKTLNILKAEAKETINSKAETLCASLVTSGITQSIRYERKLSQAEAFLKDSKPSQAKYPLIYSEVGTTASTAEGVAMSICTKSEQCNSYFDKVETVRIQGHGAINQATTAKEIDEVLSNIVWP